VDRQQRLGDRCDGRFHRLLHVSRRRLHGRRRHREPVRACACAALLHMRPHFAAQAPVPRCDARRCAHAHATNGCPSGRAACCRTTT
jgi:hypothetical protein